MRRKVRLAAVVGAVGLALSAVASPAAASTVAQETKNMVFYGDGIAQTEPAATYESEDAARWQMAYYSRGSDWNCRADGPYEKVDSYIDPQGLWRVRGKIPALCYYYPWG